MGNKEEVLLYSVTYLAFCLHRVQCPHPADADTCAHDRAGAWNPSELIPIPHHPPMPAVSLGSLSLDVHQMISREDI